MNKNNTEVYNKLFLGKLQIDEIDQAWDEFDPDRNTALYWTIRQLSRDKMSVSMVAKLLEIIFSTKDAENVDDED